MNKKGFTLIELLAVILILGIIALIAIPTVGNIITEAKVGSWRSTANNIASQYEQYYQLCQMRQNGGCELDLTTNATLSAAHSDLGYSLGDSVDSTMVKNIVGLKGDMPTQFDILKLDGSGNAYVAFRVTDSQIRCWNTNGNYPSSASISNVTIVDMYCTSGSETTRPSAQQ